MRTEAFLAPGLRGLAWSLFVLAVAACAALGVAGPAAADTVLARDIVVMEYKGGLGNSIVISDNGGASTAFVKAGPYEFNVWEAKVKTDGTLTKIGSTPIATLVVMFCDSAAYNLLTSFAYVELSGLDVLNGNGRLYRDAPSASTALTTYEHMSWAYHWALSQSDPVALTAAQAYIWEKESNAVTGDPFNLAGGKFQVTNASTRLQLKPYVDFLLQTADTSLLASVNTPVDRIASCAGQTTCSTAQYSDILPTGTTNTLVTQYFKTSSSSQEFLWQPFTVVPEPGMFEFLASGLLVVAAVARLRPRLSRRR